MNLTENHGRPSAGKTSSDQIIQKPPRGLSSNTRWKLKYKYELESNNNHKQPSAANHSIRTVVKKLVKSKSSFCHLDCHKQSSNDDVGAAAAAAAADDDDDDDDDGDDGDDGDDDGDGGSPALEAAKAGSLGRLVTAPSSQDLRMHCVSFQKLLLFSSEESICPPKKYWVLGCRHFSALM